MQPLSLTPHLCVPWCWTQPCWRLQIWPQPFMQLLGPYPQSPTCLHPPPSPKAMPSPPRPVFSKGLFASLEEPGSCQAPGAAASLRGNCCSFPLSSLPVGGVHFCRRITVEALCPSWPAKLFSHLASTVRKEDLPELLAEIIPAGRRGPHRVCVAYWPGSISSKLNIHHVSLASLGTMALQTNAAAALMQQGMAPQWQARILFYTQKPQWGETF